MRDHGILWTDRCERCQQLMGMRAMSYFTDEFICPECMEAERKQIEHLRMRGIDPATLANAGYLPEPDPDEQRESVQYVA